MKGHTLRVYDKAWQEKKANAEMIMDAREKSRLGVKLWETNQVTRQSIRLTKNASHPMEETRVAISIMEPLETRLLMIRRASMRWSE